MTKKDASNATAEVATVATAPRFTKRQLLASKKYAHRRDLLGALLAEDELYTADAVDALMKDYDKRKV